MAEITFIEKIGLEVLRHRLSRVDREASQIREWSDAELATIVRIERRTEIVAALAGAVSGAVLGLVEIQLGGAALDGFTQSEAPRDFAPWILLATVALLVSAAEVLVLYGYTLRAVAWIGSVAGLSLTVREVEELIARALARAALELPNPRQPIHGIDPYARVPRWRLVVYAIVYRMKVGATSFILRLVLGRLLSRTVFRVLIPLVAVPVFAIWNALIARWIMTEVRIRVAGPLVVRRIGERIAAARPNLDPRARRMILQSIGEVIMRGEDAHPNYVLLLDRVFGALGLNPEPVQADWRTGRAILAELPRDTQRLVLTILTITSVLNSRLRKAQRQLLEEAFSTCGRTLPVAAVLALRKEFISGRGITEEQLTALVGEEKPEMKNRTSFVESCR